MFPQVNPHRADETEFNPRERSMSWYQEWAPYVPVGQKIAKGHAAAKKLAAKEGRAASPVKLDGKKIAKTFWGLKWCENLERYQDISNRLPRGATYVRNGSVTDLVIEPGRVRAIVGGSEAYTIKIEIQTLKPAVWKAIGQDCAQSIDSLLDLLQGRFNEGVMQRLTQADGGLFPHSNEIKMSCSCPDYATVCKHVAATFYAVAARLDTQPELLFKLRNVDHLELIRQATTAANLDQAFGAADGSTLSDGELGDIFGIEMETPSPRAGKRSPKPATTRQKAAKPQPAAIVSPKRVKSVTKPVATPEVVSTKKPRAKKTVVTTAKGSARSKPSASQASVQPQVSATKVKVSATLPVTKAALTSKPQARKTAQTSPVQQSVPKKTSGKARTPKPKK